MLFFFLFSYELLLFLLLIFVTEICQELFSVDFLFIKLTDFTLLTLFNVFTVFSLLFFSRSLRYPSSFCLGLLSSLSSPLFHFISPLVSYCIHSNRQAHILILKISMILIQYLVDGFLIPPNLNRR